MVAIDAATRAGALARRRWPDGLDVAPKGAAGDVVTNLDHEAERMIIDCIQRAFPGHRIAAEEVGEIVGSDEWLWLVDPIDGTNNLVLGLPIFGVCVTLCSGAGAVVAAVYAGHRNVTYAARLGMGATCGGEVAVQIPSAGRPQHTTVSWIQGYDVSSGDPTPQVALAGLSRHFKRTLQLWAPSVDWALLVEGQIGAVVAYRNEIHDLLGGLLIASEAGAVITDFDGEQVPDFAAAPGIVAAAPGVIEAVVQALQDVGRHA